jgi:hypothetical protein
MFVPFVFTLEVISDYDHILPFYKYFDMAKQYGWPIIAHERYFQSLDKADEIGLGDDWFNAVEQQWRFTRPTKHEIEGVRKYGISETFETEIIGQFPSRMDAWIFLLKNNYESFEELIGSVFDDIVKEYEEPIEAILCFFVPRSLRIAADKRGIQILSQEASTIRPPFYNRFAVYTDKRDIYSCGELQDRYSRFKKEPESKQAPILTRKGLLKLLAKKEFLKDIHLIDNDACYEAGVLLSNFHYGLTYRYTHAGNEEMLLCARKKWGKDDVLIRSRPGFPMQEGTDDSPTSFHFICKCKRIVGIQSNGLFEAMLAGRVAHGYGDHPFSFMENKGVDDMSKGAAPLDFVNYVIFAYTVPIEWMTDVNHLRFLLSNPSETEVYMKTYKHYTKHLSPEDIEKLKNDHANANEFETKQMIIIRELETHRDELLRVAEDARAQIERLVEINKKKDAETVRIIEERDVFIRDANEKRLETAKLCDTIEQLENRLNEIERQNTMLLESTSWKITEPIRYIGRFIKKNEIN